MRPKPRLIESGAQPGGFRVLLTRLSSLHEIRAGLIVAKDAPNVVAQLQELASKMFRLERLVDLRQGIRCENAPNHAPQ